MNLAPSVLGPTRTTTMLLAPTHLAPPARDIRVNGRRDGNSQQRKPFEGRRRPRTEKRQDDFPSSVSNSEAWWEEPGQQRQRAEPSRQPSADDRGSFRAQVEDDDEGQGWWQKPEERSLQAYAPGELSPRQVRRLEEAYSQGRRKIKIQELAQELDLDRTEVLHWMKEFALRPDSERQAILQQRVEDMKAAAAAEENRMEPRQSLAQAQAVQGPGAAQHPAGQQQGFIPFYTRKEMGLIDFKHRRLSADAVRTLEAVYARTPFPPDDVVKGMWDLHKVNREATLQWLTARREQDGIVSSESKRRQKDVLDLSPAKLREAMGPVGFDGNNLLVKMMGEGEAPQPTQPEQVQVVAVSSRQLAVLRSSLPSPNKYKGRERNEKMGIKHEGNSLQIGSVQYVQEVVPEHVTDRWTAGWRIKKSARTRRLLPLLIREEGEQR